MKIEPVIIRKILVLIAEKKGRPHFENGLVREIVDVFRQNKQHPLKQEILQLKQEILQYYQENYSKNALSVVKLQMDTAVMAERHLSLRNACINREAMRIIARNSGVDFSVISSLAKGRSQLTQQIWDKIAPEVQLLMNNKAGN